MEKWKREDEARKRDFKELSATVADGRRLIDLAARAGAYSLGMASGFELPRAAERTAAELEDHIRDAVDIAEETGALERLDMAEDVDRLLKQLAAAGASVIVAEEASSLRIDDRLMKLGIGQVALCQNGQEPKTARVAKGLQARR